MNELDVDILEKQFKGFKETDYIVAISDDEEGYCSFNNELQHIFRRPIHRNLLKYFVFINTKFNFSYEALLEICRFAVNERKVTSERYIKTIIADFCNYKQEHKLFEMHEGIVLEQFEELRYNESYLHKACITVGVYKNSLTKNDFEYNYICVWQKKSIPLEIIKYVSDFVDCHLEKRNVNYAARLSGIHRILLDISANGYFEADTSFEEFCRVKIFPQISSYFSSNIFNSSTSKIVESDNSLNAEREKEDLEIFHRAYEKMMKEKIK